MRPNSSIADLANFIGNINQRETEKIGNNLEREYNETLERVSQHGGTSLKDILRKGNSENLSIGNILLSASKPRLEPPTQTHTYNYTDVIDSNYRNNRNSEIVTQLRNNSLNDKLSSQEGYIQTLIEKLTRTQGERDELQHRNYSLQNKLDMILSENRAYADTSSNSYVAFRSRITELEEKVISLQEQLRAERNHYSKEGEFIRNDLGEQLRSVNYEYVKELEILKNELKFSKSEKNRLEIEVQNLRNMNTK